MGINKLQPLSSGTDLTKSVPYKTSGKIVTSGSGFKTLVSVNGKGLLSKAIVMNYSFSVQEIKITIDGVLVIYTSSRNNSKGTGFLKYNQVLFSSNVGIYFTTMTSTNSTVTLEMNGLVPYPQPSISETVGSQLVLLDKDIPFNTSLLIETTNYSNTYYEIDYNIMI